jgi:hypothetical protein
MKKIIVTCIILTAILTLSSQSQAQTTSPVGNWVGMISGDDKGPAYLIFNNDFTVEGVGVSQNFYSIYSISGTWMYAAKGNITGFFIRDINQNSEYGSFTGKAKSGASLTMNAAVSGAKFSVKFLPAGVSNTISDEWRAVLKQSKFPDSYLNINMDTSAYPGLLFIDGAGINLYASFTTTGLAFFDNKNNIYIYAENDFTDGGWNASFLAGKYTPKKMIVALKGLDYDGNKLTATMVR